MSDYQYAEDLRVKIESPQKIILRQRLKDRFNKIKLRSGEEQYLNDVSWQKLVNPQYFQKLKSREELLDKIIANNQRLAKIRLNIEEQKMMTATG